MELKNPPAIIEGLKEYLDNIILGYTGETEHYYESVISWMERRHGFSPKKEWFIMTAGVVPGIKEMVGAFTKPEDSVLMLTPVYYPFYMTVEEQGRKVLGSELILNGTEYTIDFDDFAEKAARPETTLFILCSPHNPVGRVWTEEELRRIADICLENHVYLLSDEIHFDLIMPGYKHVSLFNLGEKYLGNTIVFTSPSKTFNLAGMHASNVFIPDENIRLALRKKYGGFSLAALSYKAVELAYARATGWMEAMVEHIDGNRKFVMDFLAERLPMLTAPDMEGTYLLWLDIRKLGLSEEEKAELLYKKAYVLGDTGTVFGPGGEGFERINLACPRWVLKDAFERLEKAIKAL
jgi:putative C-S lyase